MINFNKPGLVGREYEYVRAAVTAGRTASSGPFSERVASLLKEKLGAKDVLMTTSCTDALEMTAMLLELKPEDTVIVPSYTFTSTALAFARQGANIRFCDIDSSTLGMDPNHLRELLDESVKAVVPVHYGGVSCDILGIQSAIDEWNDIAIVEDNAHGLFGKYMDKPLGSFGRFSTLSFHETKNFICGEGGALVLNESKDIDRAHTLLDKGTNRRAFLLGEVDKYSWQDTGSSFGLSDLLAAFLLAQLEESEQILLKRERVTKWYRELLEPEANTFGFSLPQVREGDRSAFHMFYVLLADKDQRDKVLKKMRNGGVQSTFHYVPLHTSPAGVQFSDRDHECPITTEISGRLLRLPFYNSLSLEDVEKVVEVFIAALKV
jgi:dTDP-4-amino-4,6-dideoxygalactose transaminase